MKTRLQKNCFILNCEKSSSVVQYNPVSEIQETAFQLKPSSSISSSSSPLSLSSSSSCRRLVVVHFIAVSHIITELNPTIDAAAKMVHVRNASTLSNASTSTWSGDVTARDWRENFIAVSSLLSSTCETSGNLGSAPGMKPRKCYSSSRFASFFNRTNYKQHLAKVLRSTSHKRQVHILSTLSWHACCCL